jgi:hypothetical protein
MTLPARRRQVTRRVPILLATVIAAVALSGCAGSASGPAPTATATPEPSATIIPAEAISGTGSTELGGVEFAIPEGAKSVVIAFECDGGGRYAVELGDSMALGQAFLQGTCEGTADLAWPIEDRTEELLLVRVSDGVEWSATPTFSTAPFVYDEELTADCATFAEAYSALMNADQGYTLYDAFGEDEWTQRVDGAAADLAALAETADPAIAEGVASLRDLASDPDRTTGAVLSTEAMTAIGPVSQTCDKNQSPLILSGEFGG